MGNNKIKYGFEKFHYATYTPGEAGAIGSFGKPKHIPGAVTLSISPEGSRDVFYADNGEYVVHQQDNGFTGNLTLAKFPDEFLIDVLNWVRDEMGSLVEVANAPLTPFAMLFEIRVTGNQPMRVVVYHCMGAKPTKDVATTTNSAGLTGEVMAITATNLDFGWVSTARKSLTRSDNPVAFEAWFDAVPIPMPPVSGLMAPAAAQGMSLADEQKDPPAADGNPDPSTTKNSGKKS